MNMKCKENFTTHPFAPSGFHHARMLIQMRLLLDCLTTVGTSVVLLMAVNLTITRLLRQQSERRQ